MSDSLEEKELPVSSSDDDVAELQSTSDSDQELYSVSVENFLKLSPLSLRNKDSDDTSIQTALPDQLQIKLEQSSEFETVLPISRKRLSESAYDNNCSRLDEAMAILHAMSTELKKSTKENSENIELPGQVGDYLRRSRTISDNPSSSSSGEVSPTMDIENAANGSFDRWSGSTVYDRIQSMAILQCHCLEERRHINYVAEKFIGECDRCNKEAIPLNCDKIKYLMESFDRLRKKCESFKIMCNEQVKFFLKNSLDNVFQILNMSGHSSHLMFLLEQNSRYLETMKLAIYMIKTEMQK